MDATTFLLSAVLIATGLRRCAAAEPSGSWWSETTAGVRVVFTNRTLRSYLLLFWLSCLVYATEGVVAPLAGEYGGGARTVGLLLAMLAVLTVVATWPSPDRAPVSEPAGETLREPVSV
ncbi:hypothetical protein [Actinoplanes awajinensis]|uniref:hypothetical protein n=1 Tax=Actinoplanes awajinensis TaxID=135946 RepID=UPI0012FB9921|nr:hypothetical protein [Actinoplanes awajinensis]